jgi:hypothetical protein
MTKTITTIRNVTDYDLEGVVACYCGAKYWENLRCADCGEHINTELLLQLSED